MINKRKSFVPYLAVLLLSLLLSGCAGSVKNMRLIPPDRIISAPEEGKSMVVFMRPSGMGFAVQSSVFEINEKNPLLIGILAAKKKVSYQLEPGKHLFMVVGESADFMSAELEANKTYYALVVLRMGVWKARFSLKPIHSDELNSPQFNKWLKGCKWVEKTPDSINWTNNNSDNIQSKYNKYYSKWMSKDLSEKPKLLPQDGKSDRSY